MRRKKKLSAKNKRFRKIARAHAFFSVALFSLYIILSSVYSPEFLFSDVRSKFSALADGVVTITGKVLGPPIKPIVTIQPQCADGILSAIIDWPDDENSKTFDIDRDGLPLAANLASSSYQDTNISAHSSYQYIITARGEMGPGIAVSDPISINIGGCIGQQYSSSIQIVTVDSKNIDSGGGIVSIVSKKPFFTGTTNVSNAVIDISIHSPIVIYGQTTANTNGYWSWQSPVDLSLGQHEIFVIATNPNNPTETSLSSASFIIISPADAAGQHDDNDDSDSSSNKKSRTEAKPIKNSAIDTPAIATIENPIDFSLELSSNSIFQNKDISATTTINELGAEYENTPAIINYSILDQKGSTLYSIAEKTELFQGKTIIKKITLPSQIEAGSYRLKVEIQNDNFSFSKEAQFEVTASPAINLGGGIMITYPELLSSLGTISLWLMILLLIWLFLFSREYWLHIHALRNVTENNLAKLGLISPSRRSH